MVPGLEHLRIGFQSMIYIYIYQRHKKNTGIYLLLFIHIVCANIVCANMHSRRKTLIYSVYIYIYIYILSSQIEIFHQPGFSWNSRWFPFLGSPKSLPWHPFGHPIDDTQRNDPTHMLICNFYLHEWLKCMGHVDKYSIHAAYGQPTTLCNKDSPLPSVPISTDLPISATWAKWQKVDTTNPTAK